jgi:hypothetical protein
MNAGGATEGDDRNKQLRELARWLVLIPLVLLILYGCGLFARIGLAYPLSTDVFSNLKATYAPWEYIIIPPVSTAIMTDIFRGTEGVGEVIVTGEFWPSPTPSTLTPAYSPTQTSTNTPTSTSRPPDTSTPTRLPPTPTSTNTSTATQTHTPTIVWYYWTPTRTSTPGPTRTVTPTIPVPATATVTATTQPTFTPTYTTVPSFTPTWTTIPPITPTPTDTTVPSITPTATDTSNPTITPTPTDTPTRAPTNTSTPTPTETPIPTDTPTPTPDLCPGNMPPGEPNIGSPNGVFAEIPCGSIYLIDLVAWGYNPIDLTLPDTAYDLVYYERETTPPNTIAFDWVQMDISQGFNNACDEGTWYNALNWGDGLAFNNGHLGSSYPEIDNLSIPFSALWGSPPYQTGIAIDLDDAALGIPAGYYPCIRIYSPVNWPDNDGSEVDALEILP